MKLKGQQWVKKVNFIEEKKKKTETPPSHRVEYKLKARVGGLYTL